MNEVPKGVVFSTLLAKGSLAIGMRELNILLPLSLDDIDDVDEALNTLPLPFVIEVEDEVAEIA